MPNPTTVADLPPSDNVSVDGGSRLLSSWHATGRADIDAHLAHHRLPPFPQRGDPQWRQRVVAAVEQAGLTGRGGGGFPTAAKLRQLQRSGRRSMLVVNAMEGEPESAKDRVLLGCAPHLVLDGAQIVALAIGASEITVCIAVDHQAAAASMAAAVAERAGGALSPLPVTVERPPARYVASEESALAGWLERRVAVPAFRPDKAAPLTVRRRPVLVHNAETLAHVALIARYGPTWFRQAGTADAPGTCLVTVSGAVERTGVLEVALGTPIADIVERSRPVAPVGAVLVGGRGGAWLGAGALDTPLAPAPLRARGAAVGAGVLRVHPAGACGVAELARIARAMADESAGQCGPCVFGLPALADDLRQLALPGAGPDVVDRLTRHLAAVTGRGACRHPDGVARMVATGLAAFADDVARHRSGAGCRPRTDRHDDRRRP